MTIHLRDHAEPPQETLGDSPAMTCAAFQEQLSVLISSDIRKHEHLRSCLRCNALLDELEYISEIAKGLLPSYEPSDKVLDKLRESIREADNGKGQPYGFNPESKL